MYIHIQYSFFKLILTHHPSFSLRSHLQTLVVLNKSLWERQPFPLCCFAPLTPLMDHCHLWEPSPSPHHLQKRRITMYSFNMHTMGGCGTEIQVQCTCILVYIHWSLLSHIKQAPMALHTVYGLEMYWYRHASIEVNYPLLIAYYLHSL